MTASASIDDQPGDPSPRHYPSMVSLLRRGRLDQPSVPNGSPRDVEAWLLKEAVGETDLLLLFQAFVWRLVAAGLPLDRASLHVGTLHPQLFGYAWNWNIDDGFCDEVKVDEASLLTDAYRKNPLFQVIETGKPFRSFTNTTDAKKSPLLQDLHKIGIIEYAALPLKAHGTHHNAATVATRQVKGFTSTQFAQIERCLRLFALHVARHIEVRIAENIVTTYLGTQAGGQVLQGSIKRGAGTPIDAIVWVSDLRGFTRLADNLDESALTAVLNAYFGQLVESVMNHGGEVLKFIGDGLLAVFPFETFDDEKSAANSALLAAKEALARIQHLNSDQNSLDGISNWRPLKSGIALHRGEVFFGNVGAPRRLDFTVIGKAVNIASRVESLSKQTGYEILATEPVFALLDQELAPLGRFNLEGLNDAVSVYGCAGTEID